jgi:hypothetical protein
VLFPEQLYQLTKRDQQVTWIDPLIQRVVVSLANAVVSTDFQVPTDRALLVQGLFCETIPGAAQNATGIFLGALSPPAGTGIFVLLNANRTAGAVGARTFTEWRGELVIPANWIVRAQGNFNAGVAANQVDLHMYGLLIPAANVSR